jgi:tetratricopeptide (TPR) repeat protein
MLGDSTFISLGSFRVSRASLAAGGLLACLTAFLGALQLLLEGWGGWQSSRLLAEVKPITATVAAAPIHQEAATRREQLGRAAWYVSLAFLAVVLWGPSGIVFETILNHSWEIRKFVLGKGSEAETPLAAAPERAPEQDKRDGQAQLLISTGLDAWNEHQYQRALELYSQAVRSYESPAVGPDEAGRRIQSLALNNLAWLLATCPEESIRDPEAAVGYATRAVEENPSEGTYWNTLGVAQYRVENWQSAKDAFFRSMELRTDGDGYDWFFLGMIDARTGREDRARQWYDKATSWFQSSRPWEDELYRFQVEAAELLKLPKPSPPKPLPAEAPRKPRTDPEPSKRSPHLEPDSHWMPRPPFPPPQQRARGLLQTKPSDPIGYESPPTWGR